MSAYSELMIDLAVAEADAGRFDSAARLLGLVLGASGRDAYVLYGMGHMEYRRGAFGSAVSLLRQSLAMQPANAKAHNDLGLALFAVGQEAAGYASLVHAWTMDEELALAVMTEGIDLLSRGDFAAGWVRYEARLIARPGVRPRREFAEPRWLGGEALDGRTILLHSEQGYGDAIQFVRYVPLVAALGATVLLEGHAALLPLFRGVPGVSATFALNERLPRFDLHCPLMSLPLAFRTDAGSILADVPYLTAPAAMVADWRRQLGVGSRRRIGIAWSGNPANEADSERSIPLAMLAPLFAVPDCEFHVVQTDVRRMDRDTLELHPGIHDHSTTLAQAGDFVRTAALLATMDLIISVDTSVAHLAGAVGKPVWLLVPAKPDWRWLIQRNDTVWYPTMRLFRQSVDDNWQKVIASVTGTLAAW